MPEDVDKLQFDRAEFNDSGSPVHSCSGCEQAIGGVYFEADGSVVCDSCCSALAAAMTGGSGFVRLIRATVFGSLAGVLGAGIYFAILKITGWEVGLIAIVVGLLVGGGVHSGSNGIGGWLYQLLAMFITYCAIVATYVPLIWDELDTSPSGYVESAAGVDIQDAPFVRVRQGGAIEMDGRAITDQELGTALDVLQADGCSVVLCLENDGDGACQDAWLGVMQGVSSRQLPVALFQGTDCDQQLLSYGVPPWSDMDTAGHVSFLLILFAMAFFLPFLTLPGNIIGLAIIAFALHQAWRINKRKRVTITGPYHIAPPVAAPALETDGFGEH